MPHVHFHVDLGSAATVNKVTTSGVLFHNCTMTHDQFPVVHVHNRTTPSNGFCIDVFVLEKCDLTDAGLMA